MLALFGSHFAEGDLIGVSRWRRLSQDRIDTFAAATDDHQFIHVDPDRAAREAPFGGTIAHGFLTLSLVSALVLDAVPALTGLKGAVMVGVDRVRFLTPVRVDRRIRGSFHFLRGHWLAADRIHLRIRAAVEVEGETRPALTGELSWLCLLEEAASVAEPCGAVMAL
jgi:acyl dehydratase